MNFENLKKLARAYVPASKQNVIDNPTLELILNQGALDVAWRTMCLKDDDTFNSVADTYEYNLSDELPSYLTMDRAGLWWYDGSQWNQLDPVTIKWLDDNMTNWRTADSDDPQRYAIDGDRLIINPAPSSTSSDVFRAYYARKPQPMTENRHYPFGHNNEIPHLAILSECILTYWEWKAAKILGKKRTDLIVAKNDYLEDVRDKNGLLEQRMDIVAYNQTKYRGVRIGR